MFQQTIIKDVGSTYDLKFMRLSKWSNILWPLKKDESRSSILLVVEAARSNSLQKVHKLIWHINGFISKIYVGFSNVAWDPLFFPVKEILLLHHYKIDDDFLWMTQIDPWILWQHNISLLGYLVWRYPNFYVCFYLYDLIGRH